MTKNLMVVGTGSHVGKSMIVTALCRCISKRYSVAPFKAQNMSLNSWITVNGEEIGIAQAIQAKACGLEPTADMNPILLKPKGSHVSQVIILGKPFADKKAGDYYDSIESMASVVKGAYERLARSHDVIVIEGAGGAAEINLYDRDIVNIGVARMIRPKMILVGDIERGGVFASIYGTLGLLPEDIRPLIFGIIINKFRGDIKLLESGVKQLERLTSIPVLGVIPYMDIKIPSEDSVSIRDKKNNNHPVIIAVIRFPHISNFTDLEPLEKYAQIRYVEPDEDPGEPDAVILPGTKNTIDDLKDLRSKGMDKKIIELAKKGIPVLGICGGYQMLGKKITDSGIEGTGGAVSLNGLGLLDVTTHFAQYEKKTCQVEKIITGSGDILGPLRGKMIKGYEIHMGETDSPVHVFENDGAMSENGLIIGTYLHGLFENENLRSSFLGYLYKRKGLIFNNIDEGDTIQELARFVEANIDMDLIYRMLEVE